MKSYIKPLPFQFVTEQTELPISTNNTLIIYYPTVDIYVQSLTTDVSLNSPVGCNSADKHVLLVEYQLADDQLNILW